MDADKQKNRQFSETKFLDHLPGPLVMDKRGIIESDWKEVVESFHEMNLKKELLCGIYEYGFEKPTAFQQHAILQCIKGHNFIIQAQSYSGKTISVLISILQKIDTSLYECQALIVVSSFELARQIQNVVIALGKFMKADCHACTGIKNIHDYIRKLNTFPHVVVGTPSCIVDLINKQFLQTNFIKIFVLKEPDLMINRGSKNEVKKMFKSLKEDTQVILLSNQMFKKALDESSKFVSNPVHIFMQKKELTLEAFKQFYINNSQKNGTQYERSCESNDYPLYSEPTRTNVDETIGSNWKDEVNFNDMNLKDELLKGIYEYGFEKPSFIQQRTILACAKGHDVIVQSQNGTGKTTAVLISILQQINTSLNECQALILAPSHKFAVIIQKEVVALGKFMKTNCHASMGVKKITHIPEPYTVSQIMVGTQACVSNLISRKLLQTQFVKIFVFLEANLLLSGGGIKMFESLEKGTQVIFTSNRMSKKALDKCNNYVSNPVHILMEKDELILDSNYEGIKYFFIHFTKEEYKFDSLCNLFDTLSITQVVIFCSTAHKVELLSKIMRLRNFNVSTILGEMDCQQKNITLFHFRSGSIRILITTHKFVRNTDAQKISMVINYDLQSDCKKFIHGMKRSHYVARKGVVINFIMEDNN